MSLASFPENETDEKRRIYLRSLIDFECEVSLYALGALLRFLGQNFARYTKNNEQLLFLHIWETSLYVIVRFVRILCYQFSDLETSTF